VSDRCNPNGPAELRVVEVNRRGGRWQVRVLPDEITDAMRDEVGVPAAEPDPKTGEVQPVFASRYAFERLVTKVRDARSPKNVVFFVHGFNNTMEDVATRCDGLAKAFGVEVVAFSWPANGGGIKGVASYLSDKRDAQASVVAFDRALDKARDLVHRLRQQAIERIIAESPPRLVENGERFRQRLTAAAERDCPVRVTLMLHSMGNYLLERTLKSTALRGHLPLFDNIVMCAADVNNPSHASWVDQLQARNRLYITINEDDSALRASRLKGGDEQEARLGHWTRNLSSTQAAYVDFTNAKSVGSEHAYFEGTALDNPKVRKFFASALQGQRAEQAAALEYDAARNLYRVP
jgi:esterase/lipase superfamily enzyme